MNVRIIDHIFDRIERLFKINEQHDCQLNRMERMLETIIKQQGLSCEAEATLRRVEIKASRLADIVKG